MKVRREVLGDEHVDRATANATEFSRAVPGVHHPLRLGRGVDAPRPGPQDPLVHHARDPDRAARRERDPDARPRRASATA